ncbi:MAG: ATP-binding protein [Deltaproteobacteria bacterium]|nr:ATP-binding protein [Deltaproteobacteria bacterium]MBI2501459.1 ATP-binding protein [Deltaproteobacteria bacterium]
MEILRKKELQALRSKIKNFPVVAILGPRQCGKTTLARQYVRQERKETHFFDLEDPEHLSRLKNPKLALENLKGTIVIDEIQRYPNLFPILRVLVDRFHSQKYLILGSASRNLISQGSETLAGRIGFMELGGFTLETTPEEQKKLWVRGGFPRSFLASSEKKSYEWRREFITTFLERDLPNLGIQIPSATLRKFWMMLSHYHGQLLNASELGRSFGVADTTIKRYLDILTGTFMIRSLQPWYYNTKKRLVKTPKIYFRDSGIFHALLTIPEERELSLHPKLGSSWEGFALEQVIRRLNLREEESFFWAIHAGGELDLLFQKKGKLWGAEIKYKEAPVVTPSMQLAQKELSLEHLWVVHPGQETYPLERKITAISLRELSSSFFR